MRNAPPNAGRVIALLAAFVATSMIAGLLASGLILPAAGAVGSATQGSAEFFDSLPGDLKQPPLSEKSVLVAANGKVIADFFEENRINVTLDKIAPVMRQATIAIEDSRFYEHGGVDPKGLARAFVTNSISGRVEQGASTLTQQYVKNVLIESASVRGDEAGIKAATEVTQSRKLKEIKYAISLEKQLSKDEILNRYLNISFFGEQIYGIEAASRYYFSKSAKDLTLPEAALFAGMVQRPTAWNPARNPEKSVERRNVVLRRMLDLTMIDQATYQQAKDTPLALKVNKTRRGCANAGAHGFFCDYVQRLIVKDDGFKALGATPEEREQALKRGGLRITTTLDMKTQNAAWAATSSTIPPKDRSKVATAAVTIEPGTGKILGMAQNKLYDPSEDPGTTSINYSTDAEYGGSSGFQTGSTFKPFTLATWLKGGKSLNATVNQAPVARERSAFRSCGKQLRNDGQEPYRPTNSESDTSSGSISVQEATYRSVNTAYVAMESQLDLCDIAETAESMGVHRAVPVADGDSAATCGEKKGSRKLPRCFPSLTLGVVDIAPMTMAAAYATFASGGEYCRPLAVLSIKDRDGKPVDVPKPTCKRAFDRDVAAGAAFAMSKVWQGTGRRIGALDRPSAGKTGTSQESVQTWFAGFTVQRSTVVWVGDPGRSNGKVVRQSTLSGRTINGEKQGSVFGADFAGPIWRKIMVESNSGLPEKGFPQPPGRMLVGPPKPKPTPTPGDDGRGGDERGDRGDNRGGGNDNPILPIFPPDTDD